MNIERPWYRWFIHGYPNSSSGEGHLGWLFFIGVPWIHRYSDHCCWLSQKLLFDVYIHREGLTINCIPLRRGLDIVHRGGYCAKSLRPIFKFAYYGVYISKMIRA